jgi:hypothetical protein
MASEFLRRITVEAGLSPIEVAVLVAAGVRSAPDIDSLIRWFPSIHELGVRLSVLSNKAHAEIGQGSYLAAVDAATSRINIPGTGAEPPENTAWPMGAVAPLIFPSMGVPGSGSGSTTVPASSWPVRDQGERGTCVAFSVAACMEHFNANGGPPFPHLSAQFLYWAAKNAVGEPNPSKDGTFLQFAKDALASLGICEEPFWPYNPTPGATPAQGTATDPSGAANQNALLNGRNCGVYLRNPGASGFDILRDLLREGRPVAITLPVFRDTLVTDGTTNWTTPTGWSYGRVLNPPPTSVVVCGHAVCVVGFVEDEEEPTGGYFIVRNSWSTEWSADSPSPPNSFAPEPGYGDVSATYVKNFLWELIQV